MRSRTLFLTFAAIVSCRTEKRGLNHVAPVERMRESPNFLFSISSHIEDWLYGRHLEVEGPPVVRICIQALLQDVALAAEAWLLEAHPPAKHTETAL